MRESLKTRLARWGFNHFPAYRRTGARITYVAADWREVRIKLPLNRRTRNYVGTIFGGSMYGAVDPIYMIMLIKLLGPDYVVWDKAATIRFKHPGRTTLYARFTLDEHELENIRSELVDRLKLDRVFYVDLTDGGGKVHASIEKRIHVRRKDSVRNVSPTPAEEKTPVALVRFPIGNVLDKEERSWPRVFTRLLNWWEQAILPGRKRPRMPWRRLASNLRT